jgi:predicted hydrocarbon binding protein
MAEIRGVLLTAWVDFLKQRYGEQALTDSLQQLSPDDRMLVSRTFLPSSWYPYDTLHALRRLTRPLATAADRDLAGEIGRHMAQHAFTGVYRSLLTTDPVMQVEKFKYIGEFFFREARTLETVISGNTALVRYHYQPGVRPTGAICASLAGFWSRSIELAGASNVRSAQTKCVARGDDCCEFSFDWS